MAPTAIYRCPKCGKYLLAGIMQKSKGCPYCGTKILLYKAQRIAVAQNAFEASEILKHLKAERGFDR